MISERETFVYWVCDINAHTSDILWISG